MTESDLTETLDKLVSAQCESHFNKYKIEVMSLTQRFESVAEGLTLRAERFVLENKVSFYRNYKSKLMQAFKEQAANAENRLVQSSQPKEKLKRVLPCFNEIKSRHFLETFISHNKNLRSAANALGIPKSTLWDWARKNQELIESELRKTPERVSP